ncbi:hypothetical protein ACQ33O_13285 [Ferruginibacter sp. SUN002]|uniref:hypothetical protein n=1 Tax=Ferruginibacter sp. SUN002 TaxID=2937789 RepID=UPI003D3614AF
MLEFLQTDIDQNKTISDVLPIVQNIFELMQKEDKWVDDFFLHPLGFYYCRLFTSDQHQIRLHIWEPNYPIKSDLFIHDHFYDLCSWILCGKIVDYLYKVESSKEESDYTLFISSYLPDKNVRTLTRTNNFKTVKKVTERIIGNKEKYIIPRDTFHSNKILFEESDLAVTFVFTYNHKENPSPNVIGLSKNEIYYESDPIKIAPDKVKVLIKKALNNIWSQRE